MARPYIFVSDTRLWHPGEGWRVFPAGETDPGGAWSEKEGGEPIGISATAGALKDLIEANDRLDQMNEQLARKDHDLAVIGAERDEAAGKLADAEQRAIAAAAAQKTAEDAAKDYMGERDQARTEAQSAKDALVTAESAHAEKAADLVKQIASATQALADANGQIAALTAPQPDAASKKSAKADAAPADADPPA